MTVDIIRKLNYKYFANSFLNKKSLVVGSLVSLNLSKVKFRSNFFCVIVKKKKVLWVFVLLYVMYLKNMLLRKVLICLVVI